MDYPEALPTEEPDPFANFDYSVAEIAAFLHKHDGDAFLRKVMTMSGPGRREPLEEAAAELRAMRLPKVAKIMAEFAAAAPHELDCCPYPDTPQNVTNRRAWFFSKRQKYGLCPYCGAEKVAGQICDNGETCAERWRAHTPKR